MIRSSRVIPALLTRMSTLPNASSAALTSASAASVLAHIALDRKRLSPERLDRRCGLLCGRLVAAVAEGDVGALDREPEDDRPADPARTTGDDGALA